MMYIFMQYVLYVHRILIIISFKYNYVYVLYVYMFDMHMNSISIYTNIKSNILHSSIDEIHDLEGALSSCRWLSG